MNELNGEGLALPDTKCVAAALRVGVLALLVSVVMGGAAQAALVAHYQFDVDNSGTTPDAVTDNCATLGLGVSIDTTANLAKFGAGALNMTYYSPSLAGGADGAVTSNTFTWTDDARTMTFWWKAKQPPDDTTHGAYVSMGTNPDAGARFDIKEQSATDLRIEVQGGGVNTSADIDSDGEWHFIAVTVPDSAQFKDIGIFVDGDTTNLNGSTSTTAIVTGASPLVFGDSIYQDGVPSNNDRTPNGYLDEFRLYDEVLSEGDILSLYNNPAGGNDSTLYFGAEPAPLNNTTSATTADPDPVDFSRVMQSSTQSANVTLNKMGSDDTTYTLAEGGDATTTTPDGTVSGATLSIQVGVDTSTTGAKSGTITVDNTADSFSGPGQGSDDGNDTVNVSAAVLDKRVVTGTVDLGKVLTGVAVSDTANLTTSGSDDERTRVSVALTGGPDGEGISITGGSGEEFHSAAATGTRDIGGSFATSGSKSGSVGLAVTTDENGGAGLTGEGSYANVAVSYIAEVYQPISLSSGSDGGQLQLTNGAVTDGGQRAAAETSSELLTGDSKWSVGGFMVQTIAAGQTVNVAAATFDPSGVLNNDTVTYDATYTVTCVYDDTAIAGGAPVDKSWNLSATVTSNTGSLSVNLAIGSDYSGYYGVSDAGLDTVATFLDGTAGAERTLGTAWRAPVPGETRWGHDILSDVVDLSGLAGDIVVLEMTYNEGQIEEGLTEQRLADMGHLHVGCYDETIGIEGWVNAVSLNDGAAGDDASMGYAGGGTTTS